MWIVNTKLAGDSVVWGKVSCAPCATSFLLWIQPFVQGFIVSQMRRNSGQCSWCDNLGRGTFSGLLRPWSWFPGEIIPGIQCFTRGSNCQLLKQIEVNF